MAKTRDLSRRDEVDNFLKKVAAAPPVKYSGQRSRLIFALDATASREPVWDRASHIQSEMFVAADALGGIDIQLVYYGGYLMFSASPWLADSSALLRTMSSIRCAAGQTQINRVLKHAVAESARSRVSALVFVGDCMEEDPAALNKLAGQLGILKVPAFMFQDGADPVATASYRDIARLSGGAFSRFDANSPHQLKDLLRAVAVYAAGGQAALRSLETQSDPLVKRLSAQIEKKR